MFFESNEIVNSTNDFRTLIPRDIEKDVLSKSTAKSSHGNVDIIEHMSIENIGSSNEALMKEISTKSSQLEDLKQGSTAVNNSANVDRKVQSLQTLVQKYMQDFDSDFKVWTDKVKTPSTNESLESQIQHLNLNVQALNSAMESSSTLRQFATSCGETVKRLWIFDSFYLIFKCDK